MPITMATLAWSIGISMPIREPGDILEVLMSRLLLMPTWKL